MSESVAGSAGFADVREVRHPVRMAHLGLGAFHRAHQAWYTERANDGPDPWGIESFTGRRPDLAEGLSGQHGLYTLIVRGASADTATVISSISAATDGLDAGRWRAVLADERVGVLTLTITEAGYLRGADGSLDWQNPALAADLATLLADDGGAAVSGPARIVDGLRARRRRGAGPIAIVSCDNLSRNGEVTRAVVLDVAERIDASLAAWIASTVSFVSSMVDRITPATTPGDVEIARALTGLPDAYPVVTEPFTEWILCGDFPAGRPEWERGGARFVQNIEPFEQRKLWLLNGGHSLLAYVGLLRGHETVDEAVADERCLAQLSRLWNEARDVLELPTAEVDAATAALLKRFGNGRIRHRLAQIAADGSLKLPHRVVEVQRRRLAAGLPVGEAGAQVIAAWLVHLRDHRELVSDPAAAELADTLRLLDEAHQVAAVLHQIAPDLADDERLIAAVTAQLEVLS